MKNKKIVILTSLIAILLLIIAVMPSSKKVKELKIDSQVLSKSKKIEVNSYILQNDVIISDKISLDEDNEITITKLLISRLLEYSNTTDKVTLTELYFSDNVIYVSTDSEIKNDKIKEAISKIIDENLGIKEVKYLVVKKVA